MDDSSSASAAPASHSPRNQLSFFSLLLKRSGAVFAGVAALMTAGLKWDTTANLMLGLRPSYNRALVGVRALSNPELPFKVLNDGAKEPIEIKVAALPITDPGFSPLITFLDSDVARQKWTQNERLERKIAGPDSDESKFIPQVNFMRVKTIISFEVGGTRAGTIFLTPPYKLGVFYPEDRLRGLYEFLSFEELRLDLRKFHKEHLENIAAWGAGIGVLMVVLGWVLCKVSPKSFPITPPG
ncbi:MAG: hypothetical protein JNK23_23805 [Opitutaceae bacterium]|nr:hypothetical protein [Opitutaceae bacterium]